jgi:hypothetical protein
MSSFDQVPFGKGVEFAENTEPRCPCLLLLDTSGSMRGKPIDELNTGVRQFRDELFADEMAPKRVEVAIVGVWSGADSGKTRCVPCRRSPTPLLSAELPLAYVAWALTTSFLRSSSYFNTDTSPRTGVLVKRLQLSVAGGGAVGHCLNGDSYRRGKIHPLY